MLFGVKHGEPLAVIDAASITEIRTAAVSGAVTQALARPDAGDLAILGSGAQARSHLAAMAVARTLRRVRVWSRTPANAARFAREQGAHLGVTIEPCADAAAAVRGADIVCTTTSASTPVLRGEWLSSGVHVNAVGACFAASRELDANEVASSRFFTDRRESCLAEAGDFRIARDEDAITDAHLLGEVGDVFLGRLAGRTSADDVTVFESLGIAVEDLASAHHLLSHAKTTGAGRWLDWGGPGD